jgi:hypothetical protein
VALGFRQVIASSAGFVQAVYITVLTVPAQQKPKSSFSFTSPKLNNPRHRDFFGAID